MVREGSYRNAVNFFWIVVAIGGLGALVYFVFYPGLIKLKTRNAALAAIEEAQKEGEYPPYRATTPGKAGQEAINCGKHVVPEIISGLKNPKVWVRQKVIFVIEKVTGKTQADWGYDFERPDSDEDNVGAVRKIEEWYQKVKDDPNVK